MVLIAPNVTRFTSNGSYLGRPTANVLDVAITGTGDATSRALAIRDYASRIAACWEFDWLPLLSEQFACTSISWVDLDSVNGSTGSTTTVFPGVGNLPQSGALPGQGYSANTAVLVDKDCIAGRGQRGGRWFFAGVTETYVSGNDLDTTFTVPFQDAMGEAFDRLVVEAPAEYQAVPVVVHTTTDRTSIPAEVTYTGQSEIIGFTVQGRVASQRRRNRP